MYLKTLAGTAAMALFLATPIGARAATIIDTGTPVASTANWSFNSGQYFAARFDLTCRTSISNIQGFIGISRPGDIGVTVFGSAGSVPDPNLVYIRQTAPVDADGPAWLGVGGINTVLEPGTYWAAIEALTAYGIWARTARNPIDEYAQHSGGIWQDRGEDFFDYLDLGIRVDGAPVSPVPLPAGGLLLLTGLGGLAALRRLRQHTG